MQSDTVKPLAACVQDYHVFENPERAKVKGSSRNLQTGPGLGCSQTCVEAMISGMAKSRQPQHLKLWRA